MARRLTRDESGRFQRRQPPRAWSTTPQPRSSKLTTGLLSLVGGAGIGAAIMYLLDPEAGARRRAAALDTANRALESGTDALNTAYEGTTHALGDAWEAVSHKAQDLSSSGASAAAAIVPSSADVRGWRKRLRRGFHSYADSARSYLPGRHESHGVSGTTAGISAAGALLLGVGAMWLLDPARGRGRRAWIMQKGHRFLNETGDFMCATGRHLRNKMHGYTHEAASLFRTDHATDDQLAERVRSELGRIGVSGSSIGVRADNGRIILTGRCVTDDVDRILGGVRGVHGVSAIDNQLQVGNMYGSISTEPSTGSVSA